MIPTSLRPILLAALALVAACDPSDIVGGGDYDPRDLEASYTWVHERWTGGDPVGYPAVVLTWDVPPLYSGEAFRVYARGGSSRGGYILIATVTSCSESVCRYTDTNVVNGESYDYYVATVDERDGREFGASEAVRVDLPDAEEVDVPAAPTAVSLDGAVYLTWAATGAQRYVILSELEGGDIFLIGETDGTSFVDDRAENGDRYRYYLAAVGVNEQVSGLSESVDAYPRPDFHADIVYSHSADPSASGFRFVTNPDEGGNPIVPGTDASRDWRLIEVGGVLHVEPGPGNGITAGEFTTALSCGPGSEPDCDDIRTAPADSQFSTGSVAVRTGYTYVLRLVEGSQVRFAKIRVQGESVGTQGRRLIVFDWAYQTRVNERTLNRVPG